MRRVGEYRTSTLMLPLVSRFPVVLSLNASRLILYLCFPDGQESTQRRRQCYFLFSPGKFLNSPKIYFLLWKSSEGSEAGDSTLSHFHTVATADSVKCSGDRVAFRFASLSLLNCWI